MIHYFKITLIALVIPLAIECSAKEVRGQNDPTVLIGVTRWDAYAKNTTPGSVYLQVLNTLGQPKWDGPSLDYWPWFTKVDANGYLVEMNENSVEIMEQENEYAHNAGIDYWAFLRYRDLDIDSTCGWLNEQYYRYQESANKSLVKFCWILSHSFFSWDIEKHNIVKAMQDPLYVKVLGNRPLLYIYSDATPQRIDELRRLAVQAGMANPYIVGFSQRHIGEDASSVYWPTFGCTETGQSYKDFIEKVSASWASTGGEIVPWTPMNTDARPYAERPPAWWPKPPHIWTKPPTPEEFSEMVQKGVEFVRANPAKCPAQTVIIKEWNGPEESGLVMPGRHHGPRRLYGLKNVDKTLSRATASDLIGQWQCVEIALTSSKTYKDPFQDVDVYGVFSGAAGTSIKRPAFWDGGSVWKLRFAAPTPGSWRMNTICTDSTNRGLHQISRSFSCQACPGRLEIFNRGFLKISENGRYLTYADSTPFFYLGDTHWILPHERFDTSNVPGVPSQFKYIVDKRVKQGFTVYQSEPIWQPHGGGLHQRPDEEVVADLRNGLTAEDLPGFANLDRKFKYIADQGLVHANAMITWALDPARFASFSQAYMARVARYWVARYGAYPVIWTLAQEIDKNMYKNYDARTIEKWFAAGASIQEHDAYHHPIFPHMENTDYTRPDSSWWCNKPFHDGWAVQWQGNMNDMKVGRAFWNSSPAKPSVLYESRYDHFWTDSTGALAAGYKAFQNGIFGYGYGAAGVWNDVYSKQDEPADFGTGYELPARYFWWYDGANLKTGDQLTHLKHFYSRHHWWKLAPRFDDRTWSTLTDSSHALLSTDGQKTFIIFMFGDPPSPDSLKNLSADFQYEAQWFNPRTAKYSAAGTVPAGVGAWPVPKRPDSGHWLLVIEGKEVASIRKDDFGSIPGNYNLTVLPAQLNKPDSSRMLFNFLHKEAKAYLINRQKEIAKISKPDQVMERRDDLRKWFRGALGEFPRTPLHGRIVASIAGDGYTVQKVVYESQPNHHITAAFYLPDGKGPFPGVLLPCGHSDAAKAYQGYQRASILLAKNGFAVLCFDPLGQGERRQFPGYDWGSYPSLPEHMQITTAALLIGREAASYFFWDAVRSLDYLAQRPEVDATRLGCTGISGGGTQTSYLMALDDRVAAAAPGCYLTSYERLMASRGVEDGEQNISGALAIGLNHADYILMHAPRPTLILAAKKDFFDIQGTRDTFAEASRLFKILGVADQVKLVEHDTEHGFEQPIRETALAWMAQWLQEKTIVPREPELPILTRQQLQCTLTGNVLSEFKDKSVMDLIADEEAKLAEKRAVPKSKAEFLAGVRRLAGIPKKVPAAQVHWGERITAAPFAITKVYFETEPGIMVPGLLVQQQPEQRSRPLAIMAADQGKNQVFSSETALELLKQGMQILALDLRGFGETRPKSRLNDNLVELSDEDWQEVSLSFLINRPLLGQRATDLLSVLQRVQKEKLGGEAGYTLFGAGAAGPAALHAAVLSDRVRTLQLEGTLISWQNIIKERFQIRQFANVIPDALTCYDLPDLIAVLSDRTVVLKKVCNAYGRPID